MPVPNFSGLPPYATFSDHADKINTLVNQLRTLLLNLDTLNIAELNADVINAGTINAELVTIRSDLAAGAFIEINGSGMVVNNGSFDTFTVGINGDVTMTSALIQSSTGYPRVEMNPVNDLFAAYFDANTYIQMFPSYLGDTPVLNFHDGTSTDFYVGYFNAQNKFAITHSGGADMEISTTTGDILLNTNSGNLWTPDWSNIINQVSLNTLQQDLDTKATVGNATTSVSGGSHNHGIPDGTQLMKGDGTTVTWSAYSGFTHSHTQT